MTYVEQVCKGNYARWSQHNWLPLQECWPFNLRLVGFVLMVMDVPTHPINEEIINHIRVWGYPQQKWSGNYDMWAKPFIKDRVFQKVVELGHTYKPRVEDQYKVQKNLSILAHEWGGTEHGA